MKPAACTCGNDHIGTDVIYAQGTAMFCTRCGLRGPRAAIDMDDELWLRDSEVEATKLWNTYQAQHAHVAHHPV